MEGGFAACSSPAERECRDRRRATTRAWIPWLLWGSGLVATWPGCPAVTQLLGACPVALSRGHVQVVHLAAPAPAERTCGQLGLLPGRLEVRACPHRPTCLLTSAYVHLHALTHMCVLCMHAHAWVPAGLAAFLEDVPGCRQ